MDFFFAWFRSGRWRQTALVAGMVLCFGLAFATRFAMADKSVPGQASGAAPVVREFPDNLFGAAFGAGGRVIASGYHGAVKYSTDGGEHWVRIDPPINELLRRVVFAGDKTVFAVSSAGDIFKGELEPQSWTVVHSEKGLYLRDVAFSDPQNGWAVGHEGTILKTSDGGANWQLQELQEWKGRDKPRISGVAAIDANRAVIVGEFGLVAMTSDGGATWPIISSNELPTLTAVAMHGDTGFAVGLNGALVRIEPGADGKLSAKAIDIGTQRHLLAVALNASGDTALVGGREFLQVFQGGKMTEVNFRGEDVLPDSFIAGVAIGPDGQALAVGQGGMILRAGGLGGPYSVTRPQAVEKTADNTVRR